MKTEHGNHVVTTLALSVLKTHAAIWRVGEVIASELGISAARWQVLASLARTNGPMTVPQLARDLDVTRQGAQKQVDQLALQGLVVLEDNPAHQRSSQVRLTSAGKRMNDRALRRWCRVATRMAKSYSVTQLREFDAMLRSMAAMLDASK